MTFDQLITRPELLKAVEDQGWTEPTPVQAQAIPLAREGRDLVGIAQTGTGKTGAFLLPALERQIDDEGLYTLILCPTRELVQQVAEDARELSKYTELWVGEIYGGVPLGPQIRDLRAGFDLIVATPGRLIDHLERGNVDLREIRLLILDEADRMLDMGFRPQIEAILSRVPRERQTLLFSATMPNGVHALALRILEDPEWIAVAPPATAAEKVDQRVYPIRPEEKPALLLDLLDEEAMEQVLVFTRTKIGADALHSRLRGAGIAVSVLHGDRDMRERERALNAFTKGRVRVLVATDVAQRGLDIDGISHVINYDVPHNPDDYVHRIGRTGRAGASGTAVTFLTPGEIAQLREIERVLGYRIPRTAAPGYDPVLTIEPPTKPVQAVNRAGSRLGARSTDELSPEELKALLSVG